MEKHNLICGVIAQINWWIFAGAVLVVFAIGALWYSVLFVKTWKEINKIDDNAEITIGNMIATMLLQFISTAMVGFVFFILTHLSVFLAIFVTIAIGGWMKSNLKFKFTDWKTFVKAAVAETGYFTVAAIVFILFALI